MVLCLSSLVVLTIKIDSSRTRLLQTIFIAEIIAMPPIKFERTPLGEAAYPAYRIATLVTY